ncbi:MAG TPA: tetratricopeptide repeat protein [Gemmataceae bacterium]
MTTGEELGVTLWDAETAGGQLLLPDGVTNGVTIGNVWYDNGRAGDLFNMQLGSLAFTPDGRSLASSDLREATGFFARGVTPTQMPALLTQTERLAEFGYDFDASGLRAGVDFAKARLEDELLFGRRVIMSDGVAPILNPTSRFDTGGELDFRRIPLLHKEVITPYFSVLDTHSNLNDLIAVDFDAEGDNKNLKEFSEAAGRISALGNSRNAPGYYNRPSFSHLDRVFTDLAAYAPGMSTSRADVRAVLEAEAAPRFGGKRGSIDPKARELIDKARSAGWVVTRIPLGEGESLAITHDGRGRYAYERTLPLGLRERVVCDGETLLHLYPELGIGARRQVSRFHRAEFAAIIPDALPPAEDLSHGADVKLIGERTIAIVPHHPAEEAAVEGKEPAWVEEHLVFAENGWLAERRWVLKPADKLLARETYAPDGKVRVFDAEGKERAARNRERKPADAPGLSPDLSELVVLPVPFRTRQHVYAKMELDPNQQIWNAQNGCWEYLRPEEVLELFATEFAQQNGSAAEYIWRNYFLTRQDKLHETTQDKRLGFLVLLSAAGVEVQVPWLAERLASDDPHTRALASYLALLHNDVQRLAQQLVGLPVGDFPGGDGLVRRLFEFRCLLHRWHHPATNERYFPFRQAERDRVIAFAKRNADNPLSWAALSLVLGHSHDDAAFHRAVAGAWATVAEQTGGSYHARYEEARSLYEAGEAEKAAEKFQKLYRETLELGVLPPISDHFQAALRAGGSETDGWRDFMLKTAHDFIAKKRRPAVVLLAWQCHKVGDRPLADLLLGLAVKEVPDRPERLAAHLAAVDYLWQTNQIVEADRLLRELLKDEDLSEQPELWRFAEQVAQRRERKLDAIACLEKALDLEYRRLPPVINLEQVRNDYRRLLDHYEWLAQAVTSLDVEPPRDLLARTVRAADRWRALDPESSDVCERAARILRLVGDSEAKELAWDYLTTPIALRPNESDPWASLAQTLARRGDLRLADRAYEAAYQAEPTNAQLLWDRAENLRQLGDEAERRKVLRQIAAGDWQPRFQWLAAEAKRLTGAR